MRAEELRQLLDRRPFVPLRLHFSDGTALDIRHPEMALLTRSTVEIGIPERADERIADRVMYCTLMHVVRAEDVNGERGSTDAGGD
jgi:hypothetical protein